MELTRIATAWNEPSQDRKLQASVAEARRLSDPPS